MVAKRQRGKTNNKTHTNTKEVKSRGQTIKDTIKKMRKLNTLKTTKKQTTKDASSTALCQRNVSEND